MRHLSRTVLEQARSRQLGTFELIRVSKTYPYTVWDHRFCMTNKTVLFADQTYPPIGFTRGAAETDSNYSFDRITMTVDNTNRFWSKLVGQAVLSGVRVQLLKVFIGALQYERDSVVIFDGFIGSPSFTPTNFSFEIRSAMAYHDTELPRRTYQPSCNEFFGSEGCGVDVDSFVNARTFIAEQGSTRRKLNGQKVLGDLNPAHWRGGYVVALDGEYKYMVRPVRNSDALGRLDLLVPFDKDMTDTRFLVRRGCDKTKAACDQRDNLVNYQGFSEIPKEPASVGQVVQS